MPTGLRDGPNRHRRVDSESTADTIVGNFQPIGAPAAHGVVSGVAAVFQIPGEGYGIREPHTPQAICGA